ncbi:hypothetical protein NKR23_g11789 [Pleurostoma richardsiae]|uniref:Uncharacterized protein n=1 Tax=Pleurostoma richardsiae TaxID=41990 RepID=A0AA38VGF6_9PEZI|nr:hypothetical protein NKR23_g11789 [Pleurostoma richardsiae]
MDRLEAMLMDELTASQKHLSACFKMLLTSRDPADWMAIFMTTAALCDLVSRNTADTRHTMGNVTEENLAAHGLVLTAAAELNVWLARFHDYQRQNWVDPQIQLNHCHSDIKEFFNGISSMDNTERGSTGWWLRQITDEPANWCPKGNSRAGPLCG